MPRTTRYQAAIIHDQQILLIKHREHNNGRAYWVIPGGGIEDGETETQCVQREAQEETNLEVEVLDLLLDEPSPFKNPKVYRNFKTYLCRPLTTQASPGYEPEPEAAAAYAITEVGWFHLTDETAWDALLLNEPITAPLLRRIRQALEQRSNAGHC